MDSVCIDNGLFVGGLSKKSKLATASMVSLIKRSSKRSQFSWSMTALAKLSEGSPVPQKELLKGAGRIGEPRDAMDEPHP